MSRFLSFSCLFLVLCGCGSLPDLENFRPVPISEGTIAKNPYFDQTEAHVFKADISIYGKDFSGILAIRKMNGTSFRAALLSDFGSKLLDLSFSKNDFTVNYSHKKLGKKYIITILVEDFRLLVIPERNAVKRFENPETTLKKSTFNKGFVYSFYEKTTGRLIKLTKTNRNRKKVSIYFSNFNEENPQTIQIEHHGLKLTISLHAIHQAHAN